MIASFEYLGDDFVHEVRGDVPIWHGWCNKLSDTLHGGLLTMRSKTWCIAHSGIENSIHRKSNVMRKWRSVPVTESEMRNTSNI